MATNNCNWPSAAAINHRIAMSAAANNAPYTRLVGKGDTFLAYGKKYGINPGIAVAISQRECQLAADGSALLKFNNFGGITDPNGTVGTCGHEFFKDRYWAKYCTVDQGIEGIFKTLNKPIYRNAGNNLEAIMNLYSPPFENDWGRLWTIFAIVGNQLGITLNKQTQVFYPVSVAQKIRARIPLRNK